MKSLYKILPVILSLCVALSAGAAEHTIKVTDRYMVVPVSHKFDRVRLKIAIPGIEDMPVVARIPHHHRGARHLHSPLNLGIRTADKTQKSKTPKAHTF